jgi:cullin-associated NEDD8-dissociated protein 1
VRTSSILQIVYLMPMLLRYEDEEDTSYKIRRAATKMLTAVISTRPELLGTLYKDVSPVLISRFGDRESTVRLEIWNTYVILLRQTQLYGTSAANITGFIGGKRKRDEEGMEVEGSPLSQLRGQVSAFAKALFKEMKAPKATSTTLQSGFDLLGSLLQVLPGSLSSYSNVVAPIAKSTLTLPPSTSNTGLHIACLSFLRTFFSTHSSSTYTSLIPTLAPGLTKSLAERHPRISSEAFRAVSALIRSSRPVKSSEWPDKVYDEAMKRLRNSDTDAEVRACAETTLGDLWIFAPEVAKLRDRKDWDAVCRTTGRTEGAVQVVARVAKDGEVSIDWIDDAVQWILTLLKKGGRSGKSEAFSCLEALTSR